MNLRFAICDLRFRRNAREVSSRWKSSLRLLPAVGMLLGLLALTAAAQVQWFPAVRGGREASSAETPQRDELISQQLRNDLILWVPAHTSQVNAAHNYATNGAAFDLTNAAAAQVPIWRTNAGGAWQFTMTNFWKTPAAPSSLSTQGTFAIWVALTNGGQVTVPIAKGLNTVAAPFAAAIRVSPSNSVSIVTGDGVNVSIDDSGVQLATNVWTPLVMTVSNGNRRLFIDGIQRVAVSNSFWGHVGSTNIYVGSFYAEGGTPRFWNGLLDNPQIWTRALTSNEIFQLAWGPTNFGQRRAHGR